MNKLLGFYELKEMNLPSIPWEEYTGYEHMDDSLLWTVRSAVYIGNDLNLPRVVGVKSDEATKFALGLLKKMENKGIVLFYPYFIAAKSGTLNVFSNKVVIEAVKDDLWNLVTYSDREVTLIISDMGILCNGNKEFISAVELSQLLACIPEIKKNFRDELQSGESVMLEWSFAFNCDVQKKKSGSEYLVFYEARTV